MTIGLLTFISGYAQDDAHLQKLTDGLIKIRKAKASNDVLNKTVDVWSASDCPKITLMDEIRFDESNEIRGKGANKFKMNQMVTYVYRRQNTELVSKGDYFNSTEKDINYSAIEKTIKKRCTVTYTITGHVGVQEFVFMSHNPKTPFSATINNVPAQPLAGKEGVLSLKLPRVKRGDKIVLSITNKSGSNESFVILNHNPQK